MSELRMASLQFVETLCVIEHVGASGIADASCLGDLGFGVPDTLYNLDPKITAFARDCSRI